MSRRGSRASPRSAGWRFRGPLHGKLGLSFESLGERKLKNIERPVRAYPLVGRSGPSVTTEAAPPDRPSIAVLPFDNLSGDPAQGYFSDGVTED